MKITISLDTQSVITQPSPVRVKAGGFVPVEIAFTRGSQSVMLPTGATLEFALKPKNTWTGETLVYHTDFPAGGGNLYVGAVNFSTESLLTSLGLTDNAPANDIGQVETAAEVVWTIAGQRFRSSTFPVTVEAPLTATPVIPPPEPPSNPSMKATQEEAEAGTNNEHYMTPLRTAEAIAALAPAPEADGGSVSYLLKDANFSAETSAAYAVDTSDGQISVALPASPASGDSIDFADARGTWALHALHIARSGNKIEGEDVDFTNNASGTFFRLVYIDSTTGWRVLASGTKPLNLTASTISGNAIGTAITSTPGTWTGNPSSFNYQWQASEDGLAGWNDIGGAAASSYSPSSNYQGKFVRVGVTAINSNGYSVPAYSAASNAITGPLPDLWLKFDGDPNSTVFSDSGKHNLSFSAQGSAQIQGNHFFNDGSASCYLDGSPGLDAGIFTVAGDMTIEFMLKINSWASNVWCPPDFGFAQLLSTTPPDSASGYEWGPGVDSQGGISTDAQWVGGLGATCETPPELGVWYHYAVTRKEGTFYFFRNGVLAGSVADTVYPGGVMPCTGLIIGSRYNPPEGSPAHTLNWNGEMEDLKFYNGTCLYDANFTPPALP